MKIRHTLWYWNCRFKEWFRDVWHRNVCMKDDHRSPHWWTDFRVWVCEPFDTFVMTDKKWYRFKERLCK